MVNTLDSGCFIHYVYDMTSTRTYRNRPKSKSELLAERAAIVAAGPWSDQAKMAIRMLDRQINFVPR